MKAAILTAIGSPLIVSEVDLPTELRRGQVLIRILCSGICGSQVQEIDGIKGDPKHLPHLLGHEACGIVSAIGPHVTTVKQGDKIIAHWRKGDGIEAEPAIFNGWIPLSDNVQAGRKIKAGPITTFSEYAVVSENRVTAIPQDIPNGLAALLGCALSTAISIVEKEAKPKIGNVISVIGCGGLGLSLIFALTMRRNELWEVVGIDCTESKRKFVEQQFHSPMTRFSTHAVQSDIVIDTVGNMPAGKAKYISLQKNGTSAGGFNPPKDIPRYCEMWRHGTLDGYEKIITHRIQLNQINDGIQLMRDGQAGRVMIEM